jgi:hypothetical protein
MTAMSHPLASHTPLADDGDITAPPVQALTATRFDNTSTFPSSGGLPMVAPGPRGISQSSFFINTQTFYTGAIVKVAAGNVNAVRFNNAQTFYVGSIVAPASPHDLIANARFVNSQIFYTATIAKGASPNLTAERHDNLNQFFQGSISVHTETHPPTQVGFPPDGSGPDGDRRRRRRIIFKDPSAEILAMHLLKEEARLQDALLAQRHAEAIRRYRNKMNAALMAILFAD